MDDKTKYQYAGLKFIYEMEILDDPQFINNLKLNIFSSSGFKINDCEFLMSQEEKKILIWIDLKWWYRTRFYQRFYLRQLKQDIYTQLGQMLPTYKFRIVTDRSILDLAIERIKNSPLGGVYAISNSDIDISQSDAGTSKGELQKTPDLLPDQEQQTEDQSQESDEAVESDLQSDEEIQDPS